MLKSLKTKKKMDDSNHYDFDDVIFTRIYNRDKPTFSDSLEDE